MTDFFFHSFFFQLRLFPGFNSNNQVACFSLCPLKLKILILEKSTAHFLLSLCFMPVWMDSHWEGWSSQPRHLCPSRSLAMLQSAQQQGASSWAAKPSLDTCARAWALQMDLISADWQVSSCVYEAMLSSLPASTGSLEEIFQWNGGTGIACVLLCTDLMNTHRPNGKLDEPCRNCLKENW